MAYFCQKFAIYLFAFFVSISVVHAHPTNYAAGKSYDDASQACPPAGDSATFEVRSEQEEANVQKAIMRYVGSIVSRGCFPCCFCCEGPGDCCDECMDNNDLTAIPANNE